MMFSSILACAIFGAAHAFQQPQSLLQQFRHFVQVVTPSASFSTAIRSAIDAIDDVTTPTAPTASEKSEQKNSYDWKKQWYPVLPVSFLAEQKIHREPYKMKICGEDLVIWKSSSDDGAYSIMLDTCPHRRALLSNGKVNACKTTNSENVLACRYHGWEFNKEGKCTHIPMMSNEEGGFAMNSKVFSVPSYPTQIKGGLLWVYMDADDANPSPLSDDVCKLFNKDDEDLMVSIVKNPISWQSMAENFFDPSHAPFTHEGLGSKASAYSPDRAVPMKTFDLFEPVSEKGFALSHSPYQLPPKSKGVDSDSTAAADNNTPEAKRWFVSPATCHAESYNPAMNSTIYFVPTQEGECMTILVAPAFKTSGFIPQMLTDFARFFYMKTSLYKFLSQDRIIMQSQDDRKIHDTSRGWEDLSPTTADKGFRAFQSWTKKYGRPQFTMPSPLQKEGRQYSFWDSIAKYDMTCVRTIKRLGTLAKRSRTLSRIAFFSSIGTALGALLAKQKELLFIKSALALLLLSVASRGVCDACLRTIDSVYWNPEHMATYKEMTIYA